MPFRWPVFYLLILMPIVCFAQSDVTAPQLTSLSFAPTTIDTSSAPADVTVSFSGTDDLSGISQIMIGFKGPSGSQYNGQTNITGTTSFSGATTITFPKFSAAGAWTIFDIRTFDRAGNVKFFTAAEIAALVHQNVLTLTGASAVNLSLSAGQMAFAYSKGGPTPSAQTTMLSSVGGVLGFTVTASTSWLSVSPTNGTTPASLNVSVNPAGRFGAPETEPGPSGVRWVDCALMTTSF